MRLAPPSDRYVSRKPALVDLAVVLARQGVDELDLARALEVGKAVAAVREQLVGRARVRRLDAGSQLDDGEHRFAPLLVGHADDRRVADRGVLEQDRVDLGRIDVHAAGDDQVGAAVGEEQVAVVVEVADVAEREVVAAERRLRSSPSSLK